MSKRTSITAIVHLSRYKEYLLFVTIITLFGFLFSSSQISLNTVITLSIVLLANLLAVCSSFMINDIEDAKDDALNPDKINRNPISAGRLSPKRAWIITSVVSVTSLVFYSLLNLQVFILGLINVVLGLLYSWKHIRLKNMPVIDIASHSLFLGGLLFITSFFSFTSFQGFTLTWILPTLFISSISARGELINEIRDFEFDKKAGLKHTAVLIGEHLATRLMNAFTFLGLSSFILSILFGLIPLWVIGSIFGFSFVFYLPALLFKPEFLDKKQSDLLNDAFLHGVIISLILWTLIKSISN